MLPSLLGRVLLVAMALFANGAAAVEPTWPDLSAPPKGLVKDLTSDVALIVAVDNYAFLPEVPGAEANGRAWEAYLKARGVVAVKSLFGNDATRENILDQAAALAALRRAGGGVWLVFVGHGSPGADSGGALIAFDAQQTARSLDTHSVTPAELAIALGAADGVPYTAVVDACFSGRSNEGQNLATDRTMPMRAVSFASDDEEHQSLLVAAGSKQYAGPIDGLDRPAFSWLMLGALRGWGDDNRDGQTTAGEAVGWVTYQLAELVDTRVQTPELHGDRDRRLASGKERAPDLAGLVATQPNAARQIAPVPIPDVTKTAAAASGAAKVDIPAVVPARVPDKVWASPVVARGSPNRADGLVGPLTQVAGPHYSDASGRPFEWPKVVELAGETASGQAALRKTRLLTGLLWPTIVITAGSAALGVGGVYFQVEECTSRDGCSPSFTSLLPVVIGLPLATAGTFLSLKLNTDLQKSRGLVLLEANRSVQAGY